MRLLRFVTFVLAIATLAASARSENEEDEKPWEIHGRIVDEQGKPIEEFDAASFWSSSGKLWDDAGKNEPLTKHPNQEGELAPLPTALAKRLPKGQFTFQSDARPRVTIYAVDKDRKRGGYASVEKGDADKDVTIKLTPLVRVHGKIFCADANVTPDWDQRDDSIPLAIAKNFLHFAYCPSNRGQFAFLLPSGKYDLAINSSSPDARMPKPHERKDKDAPADMPPWLSGIRIDVPERGDLDLGTLNVELPRDASGVPHSYFMFYGKEPPPLSITDARGVPKEFKLSDLRGKWVLLDFGPYGVAHVSIAACLTLPSFTKSTPPIAIGSKFSPFAIPRKRRP